MLLAFPDPKTHLKPEPYKSKLTCWLLLWPSKGRLHCINHYSTALSTRSDSGNPWLGSLFLLMKNTVLGGWGGKREVLSPSFREDEFGQDASLLFRETFKWPGSCRATSKWPSYRRHKWPAKKLCSSFEHLPYPSAHLQQTTFVGLSATEIKYVDVVFDRHLKIVEGIHSLDGSIYDKQNHGTASAVKSGGA